MILVAEEQVKQVCTVKSRVGNFTKQIKIIQSNKVLKKRGNYSQEACESYTLSTNWDTFENKRKFYQLC